MFQTSALQCPKATDCLHRPRATVLQWPCGLTTLTGSNNLSFAPDDWNHLISGQLKSRSLQACAAIWGWGGGGPRRIFPPKFEWRIFPPKFEWRVYPPKLGPRVFGAKFDGKVFIPRFERKNFPPKFGRGVFPRKFESGWRIFPPKLELRGSSEALDCARSSADDFDYDGSPACNDIAPLTKHSSLCSCYPDSKCKIVSYGPSVTIKSRQMSMKVAQKWFQ